jgi:hypothetical protein
VRLVRIPHRIYKQRCYPLGHFILDASADCEPCLLDQLASPEPELPASGAEQQLALEQLVDQLRAAGERLQISAMSVQRAQKKALAALRLQLAGGG